MIMRDSILGDGGASLRAEARRLEPMATIPTEIKATPSIQHRAPLGARYLPSMSMAVESISNNTLEG